MGGRRGRGSRRMTGDRYARIVAIGSGKGGVGKTNVAVNVAVALSRMGYRTGILDADFGLGNVDVMLGLTPGAHLAHVLSGEKSLNEILITGPGGIQILPASSGLRELTALTPSQRERLKITIDRLCLTLDFLLIDSASGISDNVIETLLLAERIMLITSLEPSAIVDAYATAKVLNAASPTREIGVVVNSVHTAEEASLAFRQLDVAAGRFLNRSFRYYGFVSDDPALRDAVLMQRAVVEHLPQSPASRCFRILAARLAGLGPVTGRTIDTDALGSEEVSRCA